MFYVNVFTCNKYSVIALSLHKIVNEYNDRFKHHQNGPKGHIKKQIP